MGEEANFSPHWKQAGSSPVYPQKTLWSGNRTLSLALPQSQPTVTVTQGPTLSNWPKLAGERPAY